MWFGSPKSPSEYYLYPLDNKRYVERSDPDGTVAVYLVIPQPPAGYSIMRLERLRDAYDNETVFTYAGDSQQLIQIDYPSGIREKYNYAPDWIVNDTSWNEQVQGIRYAVEVSYENLTLGAGGNLPDLTWGWYGVMQLDASGYMSSLIHHYYYPKSPALGAANSQQNYGTPYDLTAGMSLSRPIYEIAFERNPTFIPNVGVRYKLTTVHESRSQNHLPGPNRDLILENSYQLAAGFLRVSQQVDRYGQVHQLQYTQGTLPDQQPYASSITHVLPSGTRETLAVDVLGRVTSRTITPTDNAQGRPRAYEQGQPGPAEPASVTWTYAYSSACGCGRPTAIVIPGTGPESGRTIDITYDTRTGLISTATGPNPSNLPGAPAKVRYEWAYTHGMTSPPPDAFMNRALVESFTVRQGVQPSDPAQTWLFLFPALFTRSTARHGVKPEIVISTSPTVSLEGGGTHQLSSVVTFDVRGRVLSRSAGGEGERVVYSYPQGKTLPNLVALEAAGGGEQVRTAFTFDDWGRLLQTVSNEGSSLALTSTHTRASTGELLVLAQDNPLGPDPELRLYYDVWGNVCATESRNKTSTGAAPQSLAQTGPPARDFVRREAKHFGRRLMMELTERRPLYADNSGPVSDDPNARMLLSTYIYGPDDLVERVILGNDSERIYVRDGYGTVFREEAAAPGVSGTTVLAKYYVDAALDPIQVHVNDGVTNLVTTIERSPLGLPIAAVDPTAPVPQGYIGSTGGGRSEIDYDHLGRAVALRRRDGATPTDPLLGEIKLILDEVGRVRRREDTILGAGASGTAVHGFRYNRSSQVVRVTMPGNRSVERAYDGLGRLQREADGPGTNVNAQRLEYYTGTLLERFVRLDVLEEDGGSGALKTFSGELVRDHLGLVVQGRYLGIGGSTPAQVWTFEHNTLGNVERMVDPLLRERRATWDALGRQVEIAAIGAGSERLIVSAEWIDWTGDAGKSLVRRKDDRGLTTQETYDPLGRVIAVLNPGANLQDPPSDASPYKLDTYYLQYDGASRIKHIYDGRGVKLSQFYSGPGDLLVREATSLPAGVSGMATREVFQVDRLGRLTAAGTFAGALGPSMTPVAVVGFAADSIGRLHSEDYTHGVGGANVSQVMTRFSSADPLVRSGLDFAGIASGDAMKLDFLHDSSGRLDRVDWTVPGTQTRELTRYRHHLGAAHYRSLAYAPGLVAETQVGLDSYARPSQILDTLGAAELSRFNFTYSGANELLLEGYLKPGTGHVGGGDRFVLDSYGRIRDAWLGLDQAGMNPQVLPDEATSQYSRKLTYTLDDVGNREEVRRRDGAGGAPETIDYTVEVSGNRYSAVTSPDGGVSTFTYDLVGNLSFDGLFYYTYDYKNRLSEVYIAVPGPTGDAVLAASRAARIRVRPTDPQLRSASMEIRSRVRSLRDLAKDHASLRSTGRLATTSSMGSGTEVQEVTLQLIALYGYDVYDRRVIRIVPGVGTYLYVYDGAREVSELEPIDSGGTLTNTPMKAFLWGDRLDELIVYARRSVGTWVPYYAHQGRHDSIVRLLDGAGNQIEAVEYDPFGSSSVYVNSSHTGKLSTVGNPYLWNGRRLDPETGLIQIRRRYLSPAHGRFLTLDPIGVWGDPFAWGSGYAYGGNNPTSLIDVNGECPIIIWIIVWFLGGGTIAAIFGPDDQFTTNFLLGGALGVVGGGSFSMLYGGATALGLTSTVTGAALTGAGSSVGSYAVTSVVVGSPMSWQGAALSGGLGFGASGLTQYLVASRGLAVNYLGASAVPAAAKSISGRGCSSSVAIGGETVSACGTEVRVIVQSVESVGEYNVLVSGATHPALVGGAGTAATLQIAPQVQLTQRGLEHIVRRHWPTSGAQNAGKFAPDITARSLRTMIEEAVWAGASRPNTLGRTGRIIEYNFGRQIGVDMVGSPASNLRVVVWPTGQVRTAFPY